MVLHRACQAIKKYIDDKEGLPLKKKQDVLEKCNNTSCFLKFLLKQRDKDNNIQAAFKCPNPKTCEKRTHTALEGLADYIHDFTQLLPT